MRPADSWKDYELIDATCGNRLERWGKTLLVRPDPQVVWKTPEQSPLWKKADAPLDKGRRRVGISPSAEGKVEYHLRRRRRQTDPGGQPHRI